MSLKITVTDEQTGETSSIRIAAGDYLITCAEPCYLDGVQSYPTKDGARALEGEVPDGWFVSQEVGSGKFVTAYAVCAG